MNNHPNIDKVFDVRDDRNYQEIDVDYVIELKNHQRKTVEVKTDSYKSGNIFYESSSASEVCSEGCMNKTQADYLFYYFINMDELYIIHMASYKNFVLYFEDYLITQGCRKELKNYGKNSKKTYTSVGYAIPLSFLKRYSNPHWIKSYRLAA